jgi:hypothetical protein
VTSLICHWSHLSSSIRQGLSVIKKHGLKLNQRLSIVCGTDGPAEDSLSFCLQFEDRVVVAGAKFDGSAEPKAVNISSMRLHYPWASSGLCSVTNLATGASVCRDALELFSNELLTSFDIENRLGFVEIRPLADAPESARQAALDQSFALMLSQTARGNLVNLLCLREVLAAIRSPECSFDQPAVAGFFAELAARAEDSQSVKRLFCNVFDLSTVRKERLVLEQALLHHIENFAEGLRPELCGLFRVSNVVFVTPEYRGVAMAGGIATMVSDLCECLQRMGQSVTVIMPYYHTNR